MKRLVGIAAAMAAVLALAFALLASQATGDAVRQRVETELSRRLDATIRTGAPARLSLLSGPTLVLDEVELISRSAGWRATGARIEATLALAPLLAGELRPAAVSVTGARITLAAANRADGDAAASIASAAGWLAGAADLLLTHAVTLRDASVSVAGDADAAGPLVRDLSVQASGSGASASLRGAMTLADQTLQWTATLRDRTVLTGPGSSGLVVTVGAPLATLRLDGELMRADTAWFRGAIEMTASDLRGLAMRLGRALPGEAAFGASRLRGRGEITPTAVMLPEARIEFDGNAGDGRLVLDLAGPRPRIEGTLAFESLDLSAHVAAGRLVAAGDGPRGWTRRPLDALLGAGDLDLRLSAGRLVIGGLSAGPSAAAVLLRDGDLTIDIGETRMGDGAIEASARLRPDRDAGLYRASATLAADRLPLSRIAAAAWPDGWAAPTEGAATVQAALSGAGASLAEILAASAGTLDLRVEDMRLQSGGADQMLAGLLGGSEAEGGADVPSRFADINCSAVLEQGALAIRALDLRTQRHRVVASGRVAMPSGDLSLRGFLAPLTDDAPPAEPSRANPSKADPAQLVASPSAPELAPSEGTASGGPPSGGPPSAETGLPAEGLAVLVRGTFARPSVLPDLTGAPPR